MKSILLTISLVLFSISFWAYKSKALSGDALYFYDEHAWVGRSFYVELILKGDFNNPLWKTYLIDGDPKIAPYVYGLALFPDYISAKRTMGESYDMVKYLIDNNIYERRFINPELRQKYDEYADSHILRWKLKDADGLSFNYLIGEYGESFQKTVAVIMKARLAAVSFLSLSVVLVYLMALYLNKNQIASVLAAFIYGSSSLVFAYGSIAYTEVFFLFFTVLGLLVFLKICQSPKTSDLLLIVFGMIIALANHSKLNGILLLGPPLIIATKNIILSPQKSILIELRKILIVSASLLIFYVAIDPFIYSNPVRNIAFQYDWTYKITKFQQSSLWSDESLLTIGERLRYIDRYLFQNTNRGFRPYFMTEVPQGYLMVLKALFVLGLSGYVHDAYKKNKKSGSIYFLAMFGVYFISILFYLLLAWERYLINLLPFLAIAVSKGVILLGQTALYALKLVNEFSHSNFKAQSHKKRLSGNKKII